jgi:transposase
MGTGRPIPTLILNQEERETLERWARRPRTAQALAQRARIILGCSSGKTNSHVAEQMHITKQCVGKWRSRFLAKRLNGLLDEARPGAPRTITDAKVEHVLTLTLESTPRQATHWSIRSMASRSGLSRSAIHRIWRAFALQPHRSETFKLSTDPLFIEKVRDIVGLYLNPPERALVLCVDEKSQIQALDRKFLEAIDTNVPSTLQVHLILDNYGTHKTPLIHRWLAKRPRFHLHFTPTSASWLNLVERWFGLLTERQIKRAAHRSTLELEKAIKQYVEFTNDNPKPFIWTKTADQILASVARFCQRISETRH